MSLYVIKDASEGFGFLPAATPLRLWAAWGWETSPSDWPPAWPPPWSRGCPSWRRRRSGSLGAARTTCPAARSTAHLNRKRNQSQCWTFRKHIQEKPVWLFYQTEKSNLWLYCCYLEYKTSPARTYLKNLHHSNHDFTAVWTSSGKNNKPKKYKDKSLWCVLIINIHGVFHNIKAIFLSNIKSFHWAVSLEKPIYKCLPHTFACFTSFNCDT